MIIRAEELLPSYIVTKSKLSSVFKYRKMNVTWEPAAEARSVHVQRALLAYLGSTTDPELISEPVLPQKPVGAGDGSGGARVPCVVRKLKSKPGPVDASSVTKSTRTALPVDVNSSGVE
jgi:hypothetical protein